MGEGHQKWHCNLEMRRLALAYLLSYESGNDIGSQAASYWRPTVQELFKTLDTREMNAVVDWVNALVAELSEIDAAVQSVSRRWKVDRMAVVDRNLLRLGAYEIIHHYRYPMRPVITDYVVLGREIGEKTTSAFINGLLDQLCKDRNLAID